MARKSIRLAITGVGNCASSLVQGLYYYKNVKNNEAFVPGLMHNVMDVYRIADIVPVAAFDIDARKVGHDIAEAIFAKPNCTRAFFPRVPKTGVVVQKGPVLDGVASHMKDYPDDRRFVISGDAPVDVAAILKKTKTDVLVNYMSVGSQEATEYYANAALEAGALKNDCMFN